MTCRCDAGVRMGKIRQIGSAHPVLTIFLSSPKKRSIDAA